MAKSSPSPDIGIEQRDPVVADVLRYAEAIRDSMRFVHNRTCEDAFYKLVDYRAPVGEDEEDEGEEKLDAAIEEAVSKIYR